MNVLNLQIFAICAFATTTNFSGSVDFFCASNKLASYGFSYPFRLNYEFKFDNCSGVATIPVHIYGNFVSDAQFFVATGVLSMLFALGIAVIYAKFDEKYKSNAQWPLVVSTSHLISFYLPLIYVLFIPFKDFVITVILAVLWLSGSAAWANSLTGLKMVTSHSIDNCESCLVFSSNMSTLNISVVRIFLNLFIYQKHMHARKSLINKLNLLDDRYPLILVLRYSFLFQILINILFFIFMYSLW